MSMKDKIINKEVINKEDLSTRILIWSCININRVIGGLLAKKGIYITLMAMKKPVEEIEKKTDLRLM